MPRVDSILFPGETADPELVDAKIGELDEYVGRLLCNDPGLSDVEVAEDDEIDRAFGRLDDLERDCAELAYYDESSECDIAEELEVSVRDVIAALERARTKLAMDPILGGAF